MIPDVYVVTDGRNACLVFTEREQAEQYAELSGNDLFVCQVWNADAASTFLREYASESEEGWQ
jgi:hypothetical protein